MRSPAHLIRRQCILRNWTQTGPADSLGTPTWQHTDTEDLIAVFPVSSEEVADRPAGRFTHRGFLRPESNIRHTTEVILSDGRSWSVDGPPRMWTHPTKLVDVYQEVDLVGYSDGSGGSS